MFTPVFASKLREEGIEGAVLDLSNYDDPLWDTFGIETVPTVIVFEDGEIILRRDGRPGRGLSPEVMVDVVRMIGERPTPKARK
jgi:hypothetical protein